MTGAASRVDAVVVHYGDPEPTRRAVASLLAADPEAALVVVDNGPGGAKAQLDLPGVRVLRPGRNLGYAAACNLAAREGRAEYIVFANNDVEVLPGTLDALAAALDADARIAAVGPRLLDARGRPTRSIHRAPTPRRVLFESLFLPRLVPGVPWFHGHHTAYVSHRRARDVETLSGAAVLVRRAAFEAIDGFDEDFFFYAEESDLFARLRAAGWRVRFEPAARAIHRGGAASESVPRAELDSRLRDALRLYARKHFGDAGERRTAAALAAGDRLRFALAHLLAGEAGRRRRRRFADALERAGARPR